MVRDRRKNPEPEGGCEPLARGPALPAGWMARRRDCWLGSVLHPKIPECFLTFCIQPLPMLLINIWRPP
jgi:hypothetical protein